ncbi:DUF21 domain-containing protein At1g47330-like [Anneissia japonica]|uniref:DUF21 domain-containing protein At1g47330-like n=1 Tax=Anneissia japonica TaxID=1529436 RepID=UPI0014254E68|nr:DUF21 domain-containing protein At1g47330-like [Anneissia japonica]
MLNCTRVDQVTINCNGTVYISDEEEISTTEFWTYLGVYVGLVVFAGLMSGLTMGLLSLDIMSLKVLSMSGKPKEKVYAKKIIPIVEKHHLLLVTLLLANAAAVESMPIFLDKITNPIIAIVISVSAVLIFGEVVPQAICTRYGLAIGATLAPLVWLLMLLMILISFPIAKLLDLILGKETGTFFRRAELGALVDLHGETSADNENPLSQDEVLIIKGALTMRDKCAKDAFTPLNSVYMLATTDVLDRQKIDEVLPQSSGARLRIPVYEEVKGTKNIIGIILTKNLLRIDLQERSMVREVFLKLGRSIEMISASMPLYDVLNAMQDGRSHMNLVTNKMSAHLSTDGSHQNGSKDHRDLEVNAIGIITLEDILEELLQEEIVDETDIYVDVHKRVKVARAKLSRANSVQIPNEALLQSSKLISRRQRSSSLGHSSKYHDAASPSLVSNLISNKDKVIQEEKEVPDSPPHTHYSINEDPSDLDTSPLIPDLN